MSDSFDAGDRKEIKRRKTAYQLKQEREDEDLRNVLSTRQGRAFIWWMLEKAGIYHTTFHSDAAVAAFQEGIRQFGLTVLSRVHEIDKNAYSVMRQEAIKREEIE